MLGLEYQIVDDDRPTAKGTLPLPKHSAGALFDLYQPNNEKKLKRAGRYNHTRIVVRGNSIQHWLNGKLIVSATAGDAEWKRRVAETKFKNDEGFGENRFGKIMLIAYRGGVWYKNLKLEPLPPRGKE